jgi:hypothetical protein
MGTKNFHGNDNVEEIVTKAASAMADEIFTQRGDTETVEDHDDTWFGVQEKLRKGFLDVAFNVANADGESYPKGDPRTYSVADLLKMDYTTKQHILTEIHQCISKGKEYKLISPYYIHYLDCDNCFVKLVCTHVGVNADDELYFKTYNENIDPADSVECDKGGTLYMYDAESLAHLLGAVEETVNQTLKHNDLLADVRKEVVAMFGGAMDGSDVEKLADTIADDAAEDVMETSDYPNYNDSDIRIAIIRTLKKKLGIEE